MGSVTFPSTIHNPEPPGRLTKMDAHGARYPLFKFFDEWPDVSKRLLRLMSPFDRSMLAKSSHFFENMVMGSEEPIDKSVPMPMAGKTSGYAFRFSDYIASVDLLHYGITIHRDSHVRGQYYYFTSTTLCAEIARTGNLDVLREARALGWQWDRDTSENACRGGHLHILQWACAPYQMKRLPLTDLCYMIAAKGGHIQLLAFLWEQGCQWHPIVPARAAEGGHLECLKLCWNYSLENGTPWDAKSVCEGAVHSGKLDVLMWAWLKQKPVYQLTPPEEKDGLLPDTFAHMSVPVMEYAVGGQEDMVLWLLEHGCPWGSDTCELLEMCGDPKMLQWLEERGCPCKIEGEPSDCAFHR